MQELEYGEKTEKNMENETQTVCDLGYGQKHSKMLNMRNVNCRTWSMARKQKIMENEKHTVGHEI